MQVPPHLLGDWDAVEASNRAADTTTEHFLRGIASAPLLERLIIEGECTKSVKMVPTLEEEGGGAVILPWLHEITKHATLYLYGMSGGEIAERAQRMQAEGSLSPGALEIEIDRSSCLNDQLPGDFPLESHGGEVFEITVKERQQAVACGDEGS